MTIDTTNSLSATTDAAVVQQPIIIDLGKKSRKRVKKLRKGKPGRLLDKVHEVIAEISEAGALPRSTQPVVVIVRERRKNKLGRLWG
ncbi:hypothetical protein [Sorangium sp. So ce131]|uniref:DUF6200 domain-containing protein n=1 Tax=Sorangium sp. So ce131 TaxID=3133282 RepID=UPI003F6010E9